MKYLEQNFYNPLTQNIPTGGTPSIPTGSFDPNIAGILEFLRAPRRERGAPQDPSLGERELQLLLCECYHSEPLGSDRQGGLCHQRQRQSAGSYTYQQESDLSCAHLDLVVAGLDIAVPNPCRLGHDQRLRSDYYQLHPRLLQPDDNQRVRLHLVTLYESVSQARQPPPLG